MRRRILLMIAVVAFLRDWWYTRSMIEALDTQRAKEAYLFGGC